MQGKSLGFLYLSAEIFLWSWFPLLGMATVSKLGPLSVAAWTSFFSAIFFLCVTISKRSWPASVSVSTYRAMFFSILLIGVGFYALTFLAVGMTQPGDVALLLMLEIPFSVILLNRHDGERLPKRQSLGALLMCSGAMIVLFPKEFQILPGDLLILLATALAPIGNVFQKRARKEVSAEFMLCVRSAVSTLILAALSLSLKENFSWPSANLEWALILINGIFLLGLSKIFWVEAIHRMPISKAMACSAVTPFLTIMWIYFCFNQTPTFQQTLGSVPLAIGMILIVR